jgi:hypothetical protein
LINAPFQELSKRLSFKTELHGWQLVTEPPVTVGTNLELWRDEPLVFNYPCHSQTIELAVQTTSKSVKDSTDYERQLGKAFATVDSRQRLSGKVTRKRNFSCVSASPSTPRSAKRRDSFETPKSRFV